MAKGTHRPAQRIVLPNGMWLLIYDNDANGSFEIKLAGYDRKMSVIEVLNRDGGAHIFARVETDKGKEGPRSVSARADDLVTVERSVKNALQGIGKM